MNPIATTQGIWLWKKTIVEHDGGETVFGRNATISETAGSLCVKERGLIKSQATCFFKGGDSDSLSTNPSRLPDGKLVRRSKQIEIKTPSGESKTYKSKPWSVHSLEKHGEEVIVKKAGFFGEKIIERIPASEVSTIISDDCNVCRALNPLFTESPSTQCHQGKESKRWPEGLKSR